jgi:hypothetical protein
MLSSFSFATYLHYVGRLALPNWHLLSAGGSMLADEAATLNARDAVIAIGFSPYALGTVQVAKLAKGARRTSRHYGMNLPWHGSRVTYSWPLTTARSSLDHLLRRLP